MARRDQRSAEAKAYHRLYKTAAWKRRRLAQLAAQPLCERCAAKGRITVATVANHKIPHKGDLTLFHEGEIESVCAPCHDRDIQSEERRGYSKAIGPDGWPMDERHPVHRGAL